MMLRSKGVGKGDGTVFVRFKEENDNKGKQRLIIYGPG
jgi:hypothetical protein